jgi:His-Xaa-Ser system protein HxsD
MADSPAPSIRLQHHLMHSTHSFSVQLSLSVYRLSAIQKAAYKLSGRSVIQIRPVEQQLVEVILEGADLTADLQELRRDFLREVIDQELREVVMQETAGIRNLLLAQAFSSTSLIQGDDNVTDYLEDPQQISLPDASPL